jgi:hypothetical protein
MNQPVAARALGWWSEVSAVNRHARARGQRLKCGRFRPPNMPADLKVKSARVMDFPARFQKSPAFVIEFPRHTGRIVEA